MFVPLYVHSEYSILNSLAKLEDLIQSAKEKSFDTLALTDISSLKACYKFYKACKKESIKPLIGTLCHIKFNGIVSAILLYAKDTTGFVNLNIILSIENTKQRAVELSEFTKYTKGLLCIVPGEDSFVFECFKNRDLENAKSYYSSLNSVFDDLYLGLTHLSSYTIFNFDSYYEFSRTITNNLVGLSKVLYLEPSHFETYNTLKKIRESSNYQQKYNKDVENIIHSVSNSDENAYLFYKEEYLEIFSKYPELINNTVVIANKLNIYFNFGQTLIPEYDNIDTKTYLYELSHTGLRKRLSFVDTSKIDINSYFDRLTTELRVINDMGFNDYFLIVYDYVKYAKTNNIYVGPGRGSAGASLVAYSLGITDVDPIKYNLYFERFLNPERVTMPDIDIDFQDDLREKVIEYVSNKYGKGRVAHISTLTTFQAKMSINEVSKVYNLDSTRIHAINNAIFKKNSNVILKEEILNNEQLKRLMNEYDDIDKVVRISSIIQGLPKSISTHAAGIFVSRYNLTNYTYLESCSANIYQTGIDAEDLEEIGLLKMDFLALRNATNIASCLNMIKEDKNDFSLPKEENDRNVFKMLSSGDVLGVFQLESTGMKNVITSIGIDSFDDIVLALALYRPGPMDNIPLITNRKKNLEKVYYPNQVLKSILSDTYGIIVYQEQIMMLACKIAGYSLGKADILRRAVSKKNKEVILNEEKNFINCSVANGYDANLAKSIYDMIVKFASYGFNKAHSVAYAKVAYITAYLKYYFPSEYISTLLNQSIGNQEAIYDYLKYLKSRDIKFMLPNLEYSENIFKVINNIVYMPFTCIKGISESKTLELMNERRKGPFRSYKDFVERCYNILTKENIENLIYSSCLDCFNLTKKALVESLNWHIDIVNYKDMPGLLDYNYTDDEYPYNELVEKEKEALDMNIKYSLFKQFEYVYKDLSIKTINKAYGLNYIKTVGLIKKIKVLTDKNNNKMAFCELADETGEIELTIFSKTYDKYGSDLEIDVAYIVSGSIQERKNTQIVVNTIERLK